MPIQPPSDTPIMRQIQIRSRRRGDLLQESRHGGGVEVRGVEVLALAVDLKGEHAGCGGDVVRVVEGDAEVVGFCCGFLGVDVGC